MKVEVVYALPGKAEVVSLQLPEDATVADALAAAGFSANAFGIFGKQVPATHSLRDGDRIEIYRPLEIDPKEARRLRTKKRR